MPGNAFEWCQDEAFLFETDAGRMGDKEQVGKLDNSVFRVLRGGSFYLTAADVRSANSSPYRPDDRNSSYGFRGSRTLLPNPLTALPPAEGGKNLKIQ